MGKAGCASGSVGGRSSRPGDESSRDQEEPTCPAQPALPRAKNATSLLPSARDTPLIEGALWRMPVGSLVGHLFRLGADLHYGRGFPGSGGAAAHSVALDAGPCSHWPYSLRACEDGSLPDPSRRASTPEGRHGTSRRSRWSSRARRIFRLQQVRRRSESILATTGHLAYLPVRQECSATDQVVRIARWLFPSLGRPPQNGCPTDG